MKIEERTINDLTILDLKGKVLVSEGDKMLREKIESLMQAGKSKILLNLAGVPFVDSAGLGEMVCSLARVSSKNGKLKLLNLTKRIRDLLTITKLETVFDTYDNEQEAVRSF